MLIEHLVIIGNAPHFKEQDKTEPTIVRFNHFIDWSAFSWWKMLLLRVVGIKPI